LLVVCLSVIDDPHRGDLVPLGLPHHDKKNSTATGRKQRGKSVYNRRNIVVLSRIIRTDGFRTEGVSYTQGSVSSIVQAQ
jgi:hypothetical protein